MLVSGNHFDKFFIPEGDSPVDLNTAGHWVESDVWNKIVLSLPDGYTILDPEFFNIIQLNIKLPVN